MPALQKKHNNTDTQKNTAQLLSPCLLLLWKAAPCHARTQTHTCTHPPQKPLHQQCYRSGAVSHCSCDTELILKRQLCEAENTMKPNA